MKRGVLNFLIFCIFLYIFFTTSILRNKNLSYQNCVHHSLNIRESKHNWYYVGNIVADCSSLLKLKSISFVENNDEKKFFILPDSKIYYFLNLVTIGVGQDLNAEQKLRKIWTGTFHFTAADPIEEGNRELVESLNGRFLPMAIGLSTGTYNASILPFGATKPPPPITKDEILSDILGNRTSYISKPVKHKAFIDFLTDFVGKSVIHMLWIDMEGTEYEILPLISSNRFFDHGISVCQINIEIHRPSESQKIEIADFLRNISSPNSAFAIVKVVRIFHIRLFLVNIVDKRC